MIELVEKLLKVKRELSTKSGLPSSNVVLCMSDGKNVIRNGDIFTIFLEGDSDKPVRTVHVSWLTSSGDPGARKLRKLISTARVITDKK